MFRLRGDLRGIVRKPGEGIDARVFSGERVMLSVVRAKFGRTSKRLGKA